MDRLDMERRDWMHSRQSRLLISANCYIERTVPFRVSHRKFERVGNEETTGVILHPERLKRVPKGPKIFVNSLSDLFHEEIPEQFVRDVFDVMAAHPDRTFQVLTKRPERMLELVSRYYTSVGELVARGFWGARIPMPFENVWLGVSIENSRQTWRADFLRATPAAVRFISAEPLLGSLFESTPTPNLRQAIEGIGVRQKKPLDLTGIDWVIVGGESGGRKARPMHPDWACEIRDACLATDPLPTDAAWVTHGTRFLFKQMGSWALAPKDGGVKQGDICLSEDGERYDVDADYVCAPNESDGTWMRYAGATAKSGGRRLDGREWHEIPRQNRA